MLAYDYPMAGTFWTLTFLAFSVLWVYSVIWCFIDNFRSQDHQGLAKGLWFLALLLFPVAGVFAYLVSPSLPAGRRTSLGNADPDRATLAWYLPPKPRAVIAVCLVALRRASCSRRTTSESGASRT